MYVDNKEKGTSTIKCNAKGCTKSFAGKNHGDAWRKAHAAGWSTPNAAEAWCSDHKPSRAKATKKVAAKTKAAKSAKTSKPAAKKGTGVVRGTGKSAVWEYKPAETNE